MSLVEPFIVYGDADSAGQHRLVRLADVFIAEPDGQPPYTRIAMLFADCPGLTLVLILVGRRTVVVGARDGTIAVLHLTAATSVRQAAVVLYQAWLDNSARMTSARGEPSSS